jgi:hypothetical protein
MRILLLARRWLYAALLAMAAVTWFTRDRLGSVNDIHPDTLRPAEQTAASFTNSFRFTRNGYEYEVTPLFDYVISGLVVHRLDYSWFSIDRSEKIFALDLCLIWGANLRHKVHQARTIRFSQDCRFCFVEWREQLPFSMAELSNNHLLTNQPEVEKTLNRIRTGDQLKLRGKLVKVNARLIGKGGRHDSEAVRWTSSTTRNDTGAGACEVIYVEDAVVLRTANTLARVLFRVSLWALAVLMFWEIFLLVRP